VLLVVPTLGVALGWGILELTTFRIQSSSISKCLIFLTISCKILQAILNTVSTAIIAAAIRTKPSDEPSLKLYLMPSLQPLLQLSSELPTKPSLKRPGSHGHEPYDCGPVSKMEPLGPWLHPGDSLLQMWPFYKELCCPFLFIRTTQGFLQYEDEENVRYFHGIAISWAPSAQSIPVHAKTILLKNPAPLIHQLYYYYPLIHKPRLPIPSKSITCQPSPSVTSLYLMDCSWWNCVTIYSPT
jgi:hypothetical protein